MPSDNEPSATAAFRLATTRAVVAQTEAARRRRLPNGLTPEQDTELRRLAAAAIDACNRVIATVDADLEVELDLDSPLLRTVDRA